MARPFVPPEIPSFRGNLNLEADIGGSLAVPTGSGQLSITEAAFRDEAITAATAEFAIANDVATLNARITTLPETAPITLQGDIPLNGRSQYNLQLTDEGLRFINLLSDTIAWEAGSGSLNITLTGTQAAPNIEGILALRQASYGCRRYPNRSRSLRARFILVGVNCRRITLMAAMAMVRSWFGVGSPCGPMERPSPSRSVSRLWS
ncbi:MAG: hypothetical protein HC926_03930 [Synechococcaceae cyanobacterium SM2_3_60]|nr:hypothetical protein [Synechococcaceae cyanobacterium SM2_3_60]